MSNKILKNALENFVIRRIISFFKGKGQYATGLQTSAMFKEIFSSSTIVAGYMKIKKDYLRHFWIVTDEGRIIDIAQKVSKVYPVTFPIFKSLKGIGKPYVSPFRIGNINIKFVEDKYKVYKEEGW